jgi:hypothetical protein
MHQTPFKRMPAAAVIMALIAELQSAPQKPHQLSAHRPLDTQAGRKLH